MHHHHHDSLAQTRTEVGTQDKRSKSLINCFQYSFAIIPLLIPYHNASSGLINVSLPLKTLVQFQVHIIDHLVLSRTSKMGTA